MKKAQLAVLAAMALAVAAPAVAKMGKSADVRVGGEAMMASRDIVDNAVNSADHTTLVAAVQAAGLVQTLKSAGPFTVFAPTNDAFENLPDGTVETLLKPENKATLTRVLTYHVVAGRMSMADLWKAVRAGDGTAALKTVSGGQLWVKANGPSNLIVQDENGKAANISTYDVQQSNGVIHVIDRVVLPK